ncbi:hypothetical protein GCM10022409_12730 [Hymenobacter glaciei]|uniref:Uncharacterized protein n=1 Tax=Hymenobacter glaciei TaxID=877209 RepID=A0ABP7TRI3_9BACT
MEVNPVVSAGIGLSGCLIVSLGESGIEFSLDYLTYRHYHKILGRRFGPWQTLPTVMGVTLKYFSSKSSASSKYDWSDVPKQHQTLIVMLSVANTRDGIIVAYFSMNDINQASDFVHEIAEKLHVPVNIYLPSNQFKPL